MHSAAPWPLRASRRVPWQLATKACACEDGELVELLHGNLAPIARSVAFSLIAHVEQYSTDREISEIIGLAFGDAVGIEAATIAGFPPSIQGLGRCDGSRLQAVCEPPLVKAPDVPKEPTIWPELFTPDAMLVSCLYVRSQSLKPWAFAEECETKVPTFPNEILFHFPAAVEKDRGLTLGKAKLPMQLHFNVWSKEGAHAPFHLWLALSDAKSAVADRHA
jgi:hypothetical protein